MRKKLFAVIMSAMMMITFMPAMAFAGTYWMNDPDNVQKNTKTGFYVEGVARTAATAKTNLTWDDDFFYDGKEHKVTFVAGTEAVSPVTHFWPTNVYPTRPVVTGYTMAYKKHDARYYPTAVKTDAPVVKDAGDYKITATVDWVANSVKMSETFTFDLYVAKRALKVSGLAQIVKTKDYDGKPVEITADELTAEAFKNANGKDEWYSGLAEGDKLITGTIKTGVDAGTYWYTYEQLINPNYDVWVEKNTYAPNGNQFVTVVINKANNKAAIASQVLTIKKGSSKAVTFSAKFGTAKLTKLSGNTKISVKNGKIKVAKSCKKGTYKVKVKASVDGNANYASASRVKTLTIKVK